MKTVTMQHPTIKRIRFDVPAKSAKRWERSGWQNLGDTVADPDSSELPRGNAKRAEWEGFAAARGIDVAEGATREDIKAAVEGDTETS